VCNFARLVGIRMEKINQLGLPSQCKYFGFVVVPKGFKIMQLVMPIMLLKMGFLERQRINVNVKCATFPNRVKTIDGLLQSIIKYCVHCAHWWVHRIPI